MKKNHFSKCYKCPTWKVNVLFLIVTNLPSEEQICMNHVAAVLHQYQKEPRHCLFRLVHTHTHKKKDLSFYSRKGQTHHSASVYMVIYAKLSQQLFIIMRNPHLKKNPAVALVLFKFLKECNLA